MVKVILPDIFDPLTEIHNLAGQDAICGDVYHVENQHPEYQNRGCQSLHRIVLGPLAVYSKTSKYKTDDGAAGIPEENGCFIFF